MKNDDILLTNIQRFSLHDGPGIRTTVFLKGCGIRCPWCSNPENVENQIQKYSKDGIKGEYGKWYTNSQLFEEVIKDRAFYGNIDPKCWTIENASQIEDLPGGITFSGGEPMLQIKKFVPLLEKLNNEKIHTAIETSLFASEDSVEIALRNIALFYVDVKLLGREDVQNFLQGNLDVFLKNIDTVFQWRDFNGRHKPTIVRIPVIGGYTDSEKNRKLVKKLLDEYVDLHIGPIKIELIKEHNLGIRKYKSLGIQAPDYKGVSNKLVEKYKEELDGLGIPIEICGI